MSATQYRLSQQKKSAIVFRFIGARSVVINDFSLNSLKIISLFSFAWFRWNHVHTFGNMILAILMTVRRLPSVKNHATISLIFSSAVLKSVICCPKWAKKSKKKSLDKSVITLHTFGAISKSIPFFFKKKKCFSFICHASFSFLFFHIFSVIETFKSHQKANL